MTDILLAIIAAIAASASLVLLFVNRVPSALVAFFALWILNQSHYVAFAPGYILTWLVITLIIIALDMMNAIAEHFSRTVVAYMRTGSIAGMLCGIAINPAGLIPGSAIGALLAFLAYTRTPAAAKLQFSSSAFIQYFCANGFRIVATTSMVGTLIAAVLARYNASVALNL